jgi:hypothetical protein
VQHLIGSSKFLFNNNRSKDLNSIQSVARITIIMFTESCQRSVRSNVHVLHTHLKISLAFVDGDDETVDLAEKFVTFRLMEEFGAGLQQFGQVILCDTPNTCRILSCRRWLHLSGYGLYN